MGNQYPTDDQRRVARYLALHPTEPSTWPMALIDELLHTEQVDGHKRMMELISQIGARSRRA